MTGAPKGLYSIPILFLIKLSNFSVLLFSVSKLLLIKELKLKQIVQIVTAEMDCMQAGRVVGHTRSPSHTHTQTPYPPAPHVLSVSGGNVQL